MKATSDFEDLLRLLHRHRVRYLIIGGMAFAYHAVPRFTKDMDIWVGIDHPRHQEDARILKEARRRLTRKK